MSVSLTMVPVALALRVVMGKERFNNWIESKQQPQISNFKSKKQLTTTLQRAGYDAIPFGTSIKTHFKNKNFFFWELREGKWVAIFSEYDDRQQIDTFIKKVNQIAERDVFSHAQKEKVTLEEQSPLTGKKVLFPTNFSSIELLEQVLHDNGIPITKEADGSLMSHLQSTDLRFIQHRINGVIDVEIVNSASMGKIFHHLSILDEDYRKFIQQETYNKVIENVEEKGFTIEEELTLPDESILLTLRVGD